MEIIGRNEYYSLLRQNNLSDEQIEKIKAYESRNTSEEKSQRLIEYSEKIYDLEDESFTVISKEYLWNAFKINYEILNGHEFILDDDSKQNISLLFNYFLSNEDFYSCKGLTKKSEPSLEKGLLIIGGYGSGKSSAMQALRVSLMTLKKYVFKSYGANELVEWYESCNEHADKSNFWNNVITGRCYFDDVKTERQASNYGKLNLFKDIIEKRYTAKKKTYITCNYKHGKPNDLNEALNEFGELYGGRVHDRLFEMFNIIEWKGKSRRK